MIVPEIIDLDSPVKRCAPQQNIGGVKSNYTARFDDSSDSDQLPDLPFPRLSRNNARPGQMPGVIRSMSAPKLIRNTLLSDEITLSSPVVPTTLVSAKETSRPSAVIELSSDEGSDIDTQADEGYQVPANDLLQRIPALPAPVQRSATINLPISAQDIPQGNHEPILASRLFDTIENLLKTSDNMSKRKRKFSAMNRSDIPGAGGSSVAKQNSFSRASMSDLDRQAIKAAKQAEKDEKRERKRIEKELKIIEKRKAQSISAVNVLKKSKKDCTPEMIVTLCASLAGSALNTHLSSFMEGLGCSFSLESMPVTGLVSFRRRQAAEFDTDKGYWVPLAQERIVDEHQLIIVLKAPEFLRLLRETTGLERHVTSVKRVRPGAKVLYLIEGLTAAVRKSSTTKNRAYQAAVRAVGSSGQDVPSIVRPALNPGAILDEDAVEDALLDLQLVHECFIVHSTSPADTAEQISVLTSDISTVPYKSERDSRSAQFCTETGQIKTGVDARDTFEKMLQSISRVTPQIAQAIAARYPSIRALTRALQDGPNILENIRKEHNVDGTVSGGVLGLATSKNVYKALVPRDPHLDA